MTATLAELVDLPDGSRRHLRLRMATRGGGWRWIDQVVTRAVDVAGVHGYVASVRDVDDAQRAWDALSASARRAHGKIEDLERQEAALRALLDSTADAVAVLDEHGRITWISDSVQDVSGWTNGQVMAMDPGDLVHPDDREPLGRALPGHHRRVRPRRRAGGAGRGHLPAVQRRG